MIRIALVGDIGSGKSYLSRQFGYPVFSADKEVKKLYSYDSKIQKWKTKFDPENYKSKNFSEEVIDAKNNKVVVKGGEKINFLTAKKLFNDGLKEIYVSNEYLYGKFLHENISFGEEAFKIGTEINETILSKILENQINSINVSKTNL